MPAGGQEPRRLILTASGGALRTWSREAIQRATVQDVLRHPTWRMGGTITVDCATMMNKGLEVIEAHYLFGMPEEAISVLVHPQSVVHSLVEFVDGSLLAQLGVADMRVPISYALGYPQRMESGAARLDLLSCGPLTFEAPDETRFPCLRLAREALRAGPSAMIAMNGANEAAVAAFLENRIPFGAIANIVEQILASMPPARISCVEDVYRMDRGALARKRGNWEDGMSFLYLLLAVVLLGIIITAHEFGHYIVARLTRVKVEEFAVGMGPKIVGWRKNDIDYSLRAIPLGGFCRFTGEDEKAIRRMRFPRKSVGSGF